VLSTLLFAALYRVGTWGIPLGISIANIAGTGALLVFLRRRIGRIDFTRTARSLALVLLASAVFAVVSFAVWYGLDQGLGRSFGAQLVSLAGALAAGLAAYLISCRLLGVRELDALLQLRARPPRG
jgi:peptidoglycan biosynthesis protein MviN/MurJ (putative lipid II flippase)